MVTHTGKTAGPDPFRPLNSPMRIDVCEGPDKHPLAVLKPYRKALKVSAVTDIWEITDEWWSDYPIARRYFSVILENGSPDTLFRDLTGGSWYSQRP